MKKPFEVGERVIAYHIGRRHIGKIIYVHPNGCLSVEGFGVSFTTVHPKQCRHLAKKKRREFWVLTYEDSRPVIYNELPILDYNAKEVIHVREVKK